MDQKGIVASNPPPPPAFIFKPRVYACLHACTSISQNFYCTRLLIDQRETEEIESIDSNKMFNVLQIYRKACPRLFNFLNKGFEQHRHFVRKKLLAISPSFNFVINLCKEHHLLSFIRHSQIRTATKLTQQSRGHGLEGGNIR